MTVAANMYNTSVLMTLGMLIVMLPLHYTVYLCTTMMSMGYRYCGF